VGLLVKLEENGAEMIRFLWYMQSASRRKAWPNQNSATS